MNRINEIGDTPKGQEMLGRLQARNNWKQKGNTDRDIESYAKKHWIDNSGKRVYGGDLEKSYIDGNEKETNNIVKPLFKSVHDSIEKYKQRKNESKNMNKKLIRLTESDLHKIVKESVNKIINEIGDSPKGQFMLGRAYRRAEKRGDKDTAVRASNKAWDGSEGGGRNYRNFKNGIDFQNDMDTDKAYKSLHKIFNHSVKESIDSFTSDLLPRKGWKTLATWKLNIEYNGELVYAIENRPENGEVFLLSNEGDGYHVIGYFSDLEPSQQDAIKNLLMQKMGVM